MANVLPLPREVYLEVTNRCQSLCETCPLTFGGLEPSKDLTWDEFRHVVDQFPALDRVVLHGIGEPLLNRHLGRFITYLKERYGSYVLFNSNAISLTAARSQQLIASGLDEFRISLDAATPETYLRVRGVPAFPKVMRNIRALTAAKERTGSPLPKVSFWFTGMKENLRELPELVRLAAQNGVPEIYLQRMVYFDVGMATQNQAIYGRTTSKERALIREAAALADEMGVWFNGSGAVSPLEYYGESSFDRLSKNGSPDARPWAGCGRPWRLTYITSHGNVLPCCIAPFSSRHYEGIILGNVFTQRLTDIWEGPAYEHFRSALKSDAPPEPCEGCGLRWSL